MVAIATLEKIKNLIIEKIKEVQTLRMPQQSDGSSPLQFQKELDEQLWKLLGDVENCFVYGRGGELSANDAEEDDRRNVVKLGDTFLEILLTIRRAVSKAATDAHIRHEVFKQLHNRCGEISFPVVQSVRPITDDPDARCYFGTFLGD